MRGKPDFLRLEQKFCGKTLGRSGASGGSRRHSKGGSHRPFDDGKVGVGRMMTGEEPQDSRSEHNRLSYAEGGHATLKKTSTSIPAATAARW
eukprot:CAMPEP_0185261870 /NCGR_PEP_ID=MMETSP1359-20130426/10178_1 /TAXON_ID=552665 /ORGANISM="Bigelowiella longifila, Strain CCMP242" /LENGTH=91 /DNA_ID=CAMNT_0027848645 /DNA_START=136 /DNA_END=408 /DNA_ORIENTATION=+